MPTLLRVLIAVVLMAAWAAQAEEYTPGRGWQVPGTGLRLGGYASAGIEDDHHQQRTVGMDDFSLFLTWEGEGKLRLFSELDFEQPVMWQQGHGVTTQHAYLALERLYADYLYSDHLNLRAGKFLTPIGRWNVIHAAPLVWTTTRPLVTEHTFPTNATGAMLYGTLPVMGTEFDYALYTSIGEDWRPDPKLDPFEEAYGVHVSTSLGHHAEIGLSYANFEQKSAVGERRNLVGLDYVWSHDRYEVSAELAYRFSEEGHHADEKGAYLQGVFPIAGNWYGIGRYEFYDQAGQAPAMNLWLTGVAMRLSPAMILKAEYRHGENNRIQAPEGFFASFAVLF